MYGLDGATDLSFLIGGTITDIVKGDFVLIVHVNRNAEITADCVVRVNDVRIAESALAATAMSSFIGLDIQRYEIKPPGDLVLHFELGKTIVFTDSNRDYESYTISSARGTLVI